jgi:hypothetical protein
MGFLRRDGMKKIVLVLLAMMSLLVSVGITSAQTVKPLKHGSKSCTILPASYYFPEGEFGDFFICNGTWMSEKTAYDPSNPSMSFLECSKYEMNCRISTAYIFGGSLLDLIFSDYKVEKWTQDLITARFSGDSIYGHSNTLVIRLSDKSATIFRLNTKTGESFKEFLKDASNLTKDKTLQEYYYGREMTK